MVEHIQVYLFIFFSDVIFSSKSVETCILSCCFSYLHRGSTDFEMIWESIRLSDKVLTFKIKTISFKNGQIYLILKHISQTKDYVIILDKHNQPT